MKYSVFQLQKTPQGRKYLEKQRKKYELDMLQPNDPRFQKVWGAKIKRDEEMHRKKAEDAEAANREQEERKKYKS